MDTASSSKKRKRESGLKFYTVRIGHNPGIYHSWDECLNQVKGFKHAVFKSFPTLSEAESFLRSDGSATKRSSGPQKYYAVQNGRVPGVYTEWSAASAQITGWKAPKHKSFLTRAEAEAFVQEGGGGGSMSQGTTTPSAAGTPARDTATGTDSLALKPAAKKQKKKGVVEESLPVADETEYDAGDGPLPADAEDGFDPRITLNPATGKVEHKSDEHVNASKWQATGPAKDGMLRIYTDGSALGNGAHGAVAGVGVYFGPNDKRNISEALEGTRQTNQRAELTAILRALELSPRDRPVTIYSDSSYSINCVTTWFQKWRANGWLNAAKKPVENKDLIEKVLGLLEERERIGRAHGGEENGGAQGTNAGGSQNGWNKGRSKVQFVWVKGHKDDEGNNAADGLAVAGAREAKEMAAM